MSIASYKFRNPMRSRPGQAGDGVDQMAQLAAEPVELPDDQGVTGAQLVQDLLEPGAADLRCLSPPWPQDPILLPTAPPATLHRVFCPSEDGTQTARASDTIGHGDLVGHRR